MAHTNTNWISRVADISSNCAAKQIEWIACRFSYFVYLFSKHMLLTNFDRFYRVFWLFQ